MKKFTALVLAAGLLLGTLCIGASAAKYGKNPEYRDITAQGEYIYYISEKKICRLHITDGKEEVLSEPDNDDIIENLSISGNCLYYTSYDGDYKVYKVDISSGKKTKILDFRNSEDEITVVSLVTAGDRIYINMIEFVHDEVPSEHSVDIYDANGKYLSYFNGGGTFIDASNCEACTATAERKIVYTYPDHGDEDEEDWFDDDDGDWHIEYTGVYNIAKIKSDLSVEKITIPAKIGKNVKKFVYCGEKYVYYTDKSDRLCRYNTETGKNTVLVKDGVADAKYKDGAVYFLTEKDDVKKYQKGKVSTVKESPDGGFGVYFFDDYILYEYRFGYSVIGYDGKKLY